MFLLDGTEIQLVIDVWEGSLDIDEQTILDAGVSGIIIRLNNMSGGHHIDQNFYAQWEQSKNFPARWIYFVYNPWVSYRKNFDFMNANIPSDCYAMSNDVEVRYIFKSPSAYTSDIENFSRLVNERFGYDYNDIYTGGGFTDMLSLWPYKKYWWSRYPLWLYPEKSEVITWEQLKWRISQITWTPGKKIPGICKIWQCSGDRYKLPGCVNRVMDINLFKGTLEELKKYAGMKGISTSPVPISISPEPPLLEYLYIAITVATNGLYIRKEPFGTVVGIYYYNTEIKVLEEKNGWVRTDKGWCSASYIKVKVVLDNENYYLAKVSNCTSLNIRSELNGIIVGSYPNGTIVRVFEEKEGWGRTDKGWCYLGYLIKI